MKSDIAIIQEIREHENEIFSERKSSLIDRGDGAAEIFKRN